MENKPETSQKVNQISQGETDHRLNQHFTKMRELWTNFKNSQPVTQDKYDLFRKFNKQHQAGQQLVDKNEQEFGSKKGQNG